MSEKYRLVLKDTVSVTTNLMTEVLYEDFFPEIYTALRQGYNIDKSLLKLDVNKTKTNNSDGGLVLTIKNTSDRKLSTDKTKNIINSVIEGYAIIDSINFIGSTKKAVNEGNLQLQEVVLKPTEKLINILSSSKPKNYDIKDVYPNKEESKEDFISRFMSETKDEYPDYKQRLAVAYSYWNRRKS